MNYYISDLHLNHIGIMKHCNRPFASLDEMNETIINNWNNVVKDSDDVYILGDVCYKPEESYKLIERLKGQKHLIVGNHDTHIIKNKQIKNLFVSIDKMLTVNDGQYKIVLCHYPLVEWDGYFRNTYHFFGHIHNNTDNLAYKIVTTIPRAFNVCADLLDFIPKTAREIIEK